MRYNTCMLKGRIMAASSLFLTCAAIFAVYGVGAGVIRGDWKTFGIAIGIFALAIVAQLAIAMWNG